MHPYGSAVQQMSDPTSKGFQQLFGTLKPVAGQVDNDLGIQARNTIAKSPGILFRNPVKL
jgi:hypothetical protein